MAWYNKLFKAEEKLNPVQREAEEKLNPVQREDEGKTEVSRELIYNYQDAYEKLEVVNRGVNMIIDDAAEVPTKVGESIKGVRGIVQGVKKTRVDILLNHEPNLFQDINSFRRNLISDYILDGNIFIYYDGVHLYQLAASKVEIVASGTNYIKEFIVGKVHFKPDEIIHVKDNSFFSIYRGVSRLKPALRTMQLMLSMKDFQDNFFKNGAVPGLVLTSPNTLSDRIKDRMMQSWGAKYNPKSGGRKPMILDGGIAIDSLSEVSFKELDFQTSLSDNEKVILKALGVPPIMLDSGNNANLRPNMRMYYLETVLPIVRKINFAFERYFGFKLNEDATDIPALQPELRDQSAYFAGLVNGGIIYANEARVKLGYPEDKDPASNELRIPANIAGSAANPDEGGRPPVPEE